MEVEHSSRPKGDRLTFKHVHHVEEGQRQRGLAAARATADPHLVAGDRQGRGGEDEEEEDEGEEDEGEEESSIDSINTATRYGTPAW